ncbi:SMI1/KNR4 family protein [Kitasatospora sp. NA04385]|uniref:SMI1/KNR4 family protein n=1 Tax=Kitasatospora sp. NA04385 TaxID=2742135 RepID=UPI001591E5B6|nr:SMI1/KNR4 family protein [Kitasatospora sp. NA04385]QKW20425.1 SMI1/KNR4 family protein [Kitasatospora sp. NA04385]
MDIAAYTEQSSEYRTRPVPVDWAVVESWLGLELPTDYRELLDRHGPVLFGDHLWVHGPYVQDDRFDYGKWLHQQHRSARIELRELHGAQRPPVHPEPGGLLAFGATRESDTLFWDTADPDPDRWTVVVQRISHDENGAAGWYRTGLALGPLLHSLVTGPDVPPIGPRPAVRAGTAFLTEAVAWTPPPPAVPRLDEEQRRFALQTGTGLAALRVLTPPPEHPYLGSGHTWTSLAAALGTELPTDYREFMELYGSGHLGGWLRLHTPLRNGTHDFIEHQRDTSENYAFFREDDPEEYPLPVWPEPGGFLPFATSRDGDELGWLAQGPDPDRWPLAIWPRHADQGPPLEGGLVDVLLAWLRREIDVPGLPAYDEEDDPVEYATFEPFDDNAYW